MSSIKRPTETKAPKQPRWHLIYYLLAGFDLLTVSVTLFLSFTILGIYSHSVEENNTWAKRSGSVSDLSLILVKVNTPGNDVFESNDPDGEQAKLATYHQQFIQLYNDITQDISSLEDKNLVQKLQQNMRQVNSYELDIVQEAKSIFTHYKQGEHEIAGGKMAMMDQHFAKASTSLAEVNHIIRFQQDTLLKEEMAKAKELSRYEYLIVGLILLMICGVFFYGKVLARKMAQSEKTINHLLTRNKGILETCTDGIMTTNEQGIIESANPACSHILGYPINQLKGQNIASLLQQQDELSTEQSSNDDNSQAFTFNQLINSPLTGQAGTGIKLFAQKANSQIISLHLNVGPMRLVEQKELSYVVTFRDISQQNKLEQDLLTAKTKAEDANQAKGMFLANMSHEIRTPMNGVLGMLGLLHHEQLNEKQSHYVNLAQYSANSLLVLINDILDFSKIESGKLNLEIAEFDLHTQLANFIKAMAIQSEEKGLELVLDVVGVETRIVKGDAGRLMQILTNIVGNSIKFTNKGEICVVAQTEIHDDDIHLTIKVIDTGIGIEPEKTQKIFDNFTQADASTTREFGGTGLGLSISRQLCELMGGEITVKSKLNRGSEFKFTVKLQMGDGLEGNLCPSTIANKRLLIVDNNDTNLRMLKSQFENQGVFITTAKTPQEAIDILRTANSDYFDGAFVDRNMSSYNGELLAGEFHKYQQSLPVILMTSLAYPGNTRHLLNLGFHGHFSKPITTIDIHNAIETLFAEHNTITQPSAKQEPSAEQKPSAEQEPSVKLKTNTPPNSSHPRVLLVEDNKINQLVVLAQLDKLGLPSTVANNGLEAINTLKTTPEPFDIILMDCQMPEMDGYQATEQIRSGLIDQYTDIAIIAMTANAMKGDKEHCLAVGMSDYIPKPIDPIMLIDKLNHWLKTSFEHSSE